MTELSTFLCINLNNQYDYVLKTTWKMSCIESRRRHCMLVVDKLINKVIRLPSSVYLYLSQRKV